MSAGGEGQVYEEVGGDEESVAVEGVKGVSDPTYMEVGEGGGKTFQLKPMVQEDKTDLVVLYESVCMLE